MTTVDPLHTIDLEELAELDAFEGDALTVLTEVGPQLRIALVGTRGPGSYGGFETCVAELAPLLATRGHDVTVYARTSCDSRDWSHPDVSVVTLPSVSTKNLDTITHTAVCASHLLRHRPDVAIFFGVGNAPFAKLVRRAGVPVVFNVDGLDRERRKWSRFARWYLHKAEKWAIGGSDVLVTDARTIERYYESEYDAESTFIPYGGPTGPVANRRILDELGLEAGKYVLYVSRLEPENNPEHVIEAHRLSGVDIPLVIVGGSKYRESYETELKDMAASDVRFVGFVYGTGYEELQSHAGLYVQCTEVGGSHPALIEAMCYANPIIALDTPEHREVMGSGGLYYRDVTELASIMRQLVDTPLERTALAHRASSRGRERYAWPVVADAYERACRRALGAAPVPVSTAASGSLAAVVGPTSTHSTRVEEGASV